MNPDPKEEFCCQPESMFIHPPDAGQEKHDGKFKLFFGFDGCRFCVHGYSVDPPREDSDGSQTRSPFHALCLYLNFSGGSQTVLSRRIGWGWSATDPKHKNQLFPLCFGPLVYSHSFLRSPGHRLVGSCQGCCDDLPGVTALSRANIWYHDVLSLQKCLNRSEMFSIKESVCVCVAQALCPVPPGPQLIENSYFIRHQHWTHFIFTTGCSKESCMQQNNKSFCSSVPPSLLCEEENSNIFARQRAVA